MHLTVIADNTCEEDFGGGQQSSHTVLSSREYSAVFTVNSDSKFTALMWSSC